MRVTELNQTMRSAIVREAYSLLRTPPIRFRHLGRDEATGLDCVGVVALAYARAGVALPEPDRYPIDASGARMEIALLQAGFSEVQTPSAGDVCGLRFGRAPEMTTCAIYDGLEHVVLAMNPRGVVRREIVGPEWITRHVCSSWKFAGGLGG